MEKKELKFIADVNIEKTIVDFLIKEGFDVKWVADFNKKMSDTELFELSNKERRILITNDKDFGEIVFFQKRINYGIILFRIKGQITFEKVDLLKIVLKNYANKIMEHFVIITRKKFRFISMKEVLG
jgi:predicted nuclease of predicted toxin-antitoxin system